MKQIEVDGISVTVEHKPRNRNSYLSIDPDGTVRLKTPYKMHFRIVMLIRNRLEWIKQKRTLQLQRERLKPEPGSTLLLEGELISVTTVPELAASLSRLEMPDDAAMQRCYRTFYAKHAKTTLPALVTELSAELELYPSQLRFRTMKRQWGNCNSKGVITLNSLLVTLEPALIRYVIAHELCHLRHMNHSRAFYELLHRFMPEGPKLRARLRHLPYGMHVL